ncbi:MAG: ribonuclease E activity regulator RraA [Aeromonas sp.]
MIRKLVNEDGHGRVLVIDGGGSMDRALLDSEIATTAAQNGWEGIICYGCVRDADILAGLKIGIQALAAISVSADSSEAGEVNLPVNFFGVNFEPGRYFFLDIIGMMFFLDPPESE